MNTIKNNLIKITDQKNKTTNLLAVIIPFWSYFTNAEKQKKFETKTGKLNQFLRVCVTCINIVINII